MPKCHTCGNAYDGGIEVSRGGRTAYFDCFECAIHAMAPVCSHCDCRIIGHGVERDNSFYCCEHCAQEAGVGAAKP